MARPRIREGELPRIPKNKINGMVYEQAVTAVSATSYTATDSDRFIMVDDDTAGSAVTITLPLLADSQGNAYHIKKLGTTANVIIDGNGSETIDGATTLTISMQYDAPMLYAGSSEWHII